MSQGSPITSIRFPPELLAEVLRVIIRSEDTRKEGPWTLSSFVLQAVKDKLAHQARGRRCRRVRVRVHDGGEQLPSSGVVDDGSPRPSGVCSGACGDGSRSDDRSASSENSGSDENPRSEPAVTEIP